MEQEDLQRQLAAATAKVAELEAELKKAKGEELDRIQRVEAQLIEQDHRLPHIAWNLFKRGRPGSTDPLRHAARKAFVWFWFKPTTLAVAAGGIAAWITVYLLYQQNALVGRQTEAVVEQNQKFDAQLQQINKQLSLQEAKDKAEREADYETRKAQLLAIIYDTDQKWPWSKEAPRASLRARQEAAASFVRLQSDRKVVVNLSNADIPEVGLIRTTLMYASLAGANLSSADLIDANLTNANLIGAILTDAFLMEANLTNANLIGAILTGANLTGANLAGANLFGANLIHADLSGANLYWATFTLYKVDRFTFEYAFFDYIGDPYDPP